MPFLFKIVAILFGIFVWKAVITRLREVNKAMHDDSYDDGEDDSAPAAQHDLEAQWHEAANRLACVYDPGDKPNAQSASVSGRFAGHTITIKRFGRNYVRYFVSFRKSPGTRVCVVRDLESIAERILNGHPIFPSKMFFSSQEPDFYCSAESEEAFDRFLNTPSNRSAVLNLVRAFPAGMFNDEGVSVRIRATTPDVSVIERMAAIANALENPSQTPMPDLQTAQKKELLSIPAEVRPMEEAEEEDTPKRFPPIRIGANERTVRVPISSNMSAASDRTAVIRIPSETARTQEIAMPEADVAPGPNPSVPAADLSHPHPGEAGNHPGGAPAASAQGPAAQIDDGLTVECVCAALFGKSFPGAEERAAFEAMKGRRVRWNGELQMSLPFSMDFVFGSQKGVKATVLLCKLEQGAVPVQIKAVAAFPPDYRERMEAMKGKQIVFEGELLKFEPFAREIYLLDASLES